MHGNSKEKTKKQVVERTISHRWHLRRVKKTSAFTAIRKSSPAAHPRMVPPLLAIKDQLLYFTRWRAGLSALHYQQRKATESFRPSANGERPERRQDKAAPVLATRLSDGQTRRIVCLNSRAVRSPTPRGSRASRSKDRNSLIFLSGSSRAQGGSMGHDSSRGEEQID